MRLSRNRNWAHPDMIALLERKSEKVHQVAGWPGLLVGDLSQPRAVQCLPGTPVIRLGWTPTSG
jgi:penicillin-insensitive murein DD-endopeptidase